jgi:hypothetical protein
MAVLDRLTDLALSRAVASGDIIRRLRKVFATSIRENWRLWYRASPWPLPSAAPVRDRRWRVDLQLHDDGELAEADASGRTRRPAESGRRLNTDALEVSPRCDYQRRQSIKGREPTRGSAQRNAFSRAERSARVRRCICQVRNASRGNAGTKQGRIGRHAELSRGFAQLQMKTPVTLIEYHPARRVNARAHTTW